MPRRSNRCETCKRRKIKCDETKPYCLRCVNQGLQCEGYLNHSSSVKRVNSFRDQTQRVVAKAEASYVKGTSISSNVAPSAAMLRKFGQTVDDEHPTVLISASPQMYDLPTLEMMDTSRERRAQLLSVFINTHLPRTTTRIVASHYAFMYLLNDLVGQHPALPSAVDALCLNIVGRAYGDSNIIATSRSVYGAALDRLAKNLPRVKMFAPMGTMAAIAVLAWCELNLGNQDSFERHLRGAEMLLNHFEPEVWETNEGRLILTTIRYMFTSLGYFNRKALIFDQPKWRSTVETPEAPGSWMKLMNLASRIPGILQEFDDIVASMSFEADFSRANALLHDLLARSLTHRALLMQWKVEFDKAQPPDVAKLVPITTLDWWEPTPYDQAAFPNIFLFDDCKQCYLRLQYWLSMIALDRHLLALHKRAFISISPFHPQFKTPVSEIEIENDMLSCADDAARCLTTAFDPCTPTVSKFNAALAIKIAGQVFSDYGQLAKFDWIKTFVQRLEADDFRTPSIMRLDD